ncbi:hypothetical protein L6452_21950 [Arctium lappa]|uniref:Uncharacterized protein n=1 Tax=Arctium lappa TaxID=4217 RepID=A0ACB9AYQ4_ARCLA|nr:hypothetical protein L6452_21950 [Arctium lappa]
MQRGTGVSSHLVVCSCSRSLLQPSTLSSSSSSSSSTLSSSSSSNVCVFTRRNMITIVSLPVSPTSSLLRWYRSAYRKTDLIDD